MWEIIALSSDGDLASDAVQKFMNDYTMTKYGTPWFHMFDFSHNTKATRNATMTRHLQPGQHKLHMNLLIDLCRKSPDVNDALGFIWDSWLNPPDIMKMNQVLELTSKRVQDALSILPDVGIC